ARRPFGLTYPVDTDRPLPGRAESRRTCGAAQSGVAVTLAGDGRELLERPAQQPRDVHLADAELRGDLVLAHLAEEAQHDDLPLTLLEAFEQRLDQHAVDAERDPVVGRRDALL